MMLHSQKAIETVTMVIIVAVIAIFALFVWLGISSSLAGGAGTKVSKLQNASSMSMPSVYEVILGIGSMATCFDPDRKPIRLTDGINDVCFQPPLIWGGKSTGITGSGVLGNSYTSGDFYCPPAYVIGKVTYDLGLPTANTDLRIFDNDLKWDPVSKTNIRVDLSEFDKIGPSTKLGVEVDLTPKKISNITFVLSSRTDQNFNVITEGGKQKGVTVNTIECVQRELDLQPFLQITPSAPYLFARNKPFTLTYGYINPGTAGDFCRASTIGTLSINNKLGNEITSVSNRSYDAVCKGREPLGEFSWQPPSEGIYSATVSVDPFNAIKEGDETNNVQKWDFTIFKGITEINYNATEACAKDGAALLKKVGTYYAANGALPKYCGSFLAGTFQFEVISNNYITVTKPASEAREPTTIYIYDSATQSQVADNTCSYVQKCSPATTNNAVLICAYLKTTSDCKKTFGNNTLQIKELGVLR
ncbi:MAG: CARDB domain-containing protein [archaeon]